MNPVVSVVIPTYNRARDLACALESVKRQTFPRWEAIVVDNHSQDDTARVMEEAADERIRFHRIHNNGVIAASRNLGLREAKGEFVAFLDSDDAWHTDKLALCTQCLESGFDVVYHDMDIRIKGWAPLAQKVYATRPLQTPVFTDLLVRGNALPTSSVMVRKTLLDRAGGFSEDAEIIAGEDYDLWLRLALITERFCRVEGRLGTLTRNGDGEFSPARLLSIIGEIEKRHLGKLSVDDAAGARGNWIDYAHARAQFNLGKYGSARPELLKVLATSGNRMFRLKAIVMLAIMALRGAGRREH